MDARASRRDVIGGGLAVLATLRLGAGCKSRAREAVAYTSVDQVFSEPMFRAFEPKGAPVRCVFDTEETKSTGVLNRLLAEANNPQADVFWSGDPVRPFALVKRGLVERYASPEAQGIPALFRAADGTWTGVAARARVLLVHQKRLTGEPPRSIRDLALPRWSGQVAIANPLFGTTTIHVAALSSVWGQAETKAFLRDLKGNQVRVASSNGEVKRLVSTGELTVGLVDTDDAHEAVADGAPVTVVYPDAEGLGTLVMPTSVVLLKGAPHPEVGRRLVDFLVGTEVERRLAEQGAHMPLRHEAPAPPGVLRAADVHAMQVDYARVADEMEANEPWLRAWVGL